jgi:hypothetical protein
MQTRSCKAQYGGRFESPWDTVPEKDHCEFELSVGVFPVHKQASLLFSRLRSLATSRASRVGNAAVD